MSFPVPGLVFYGTCKIYHCFADDIFTSTVVNGLFGMFFHISLLKRVPKVSIGRKSSLVQIMAWHWTGNMTLSWPMTAKYSYAYNLDKLKE